ncbi:hypothetical protein ACONUD_05875 [Microbulbifer harenosus]|uniref:hypothetical protein n=1 Tax=Microbulbifer harenosus TaxID=2576840 RepID=UPI003BA3B8E7
MGNLAECGWNGEEFQPALPVARRTVARPSARIRRGIETAGASRRSPEQPGRTTPCGRQIVLCHTFFNGITDSELRSKGVRFMIDSVGSGCVLFGRSVAVTVFTMVLGGLLSGVSAEPLAQINWADAHSSGSVHRNSTPKPSLGANLQHEAAQHWENGGFPGPIGNWLPLGKTLRGKVEGNGAPLRGYKVSLYASRVAGLPFDRILATTHTDAAGEFELRYWMPPQLPDYLRPVLFVIAEKGPVMLVAASGSGAGRLENVVINERTTVATGAAFAQFVHGDRVRGNTYGMLNAVRMAENMADPKTGKVGEVLRRTPNGSETSTFATFNSLTNVVAGCVADSIHCHALFAATSHAGETPATNVLQAIANIMKSPAYPNYPSAADDPVYLLSLALPLYQPALTERPTNWLLFIKFTGGFYSEQDSDNLMNGPGNVAIDEKGYAWVINNYKPRAPDEFACTGQRLLKFYPWGETFPGSPFTGGGLSGAGFGVTFDPRGLLWVGNYGFEAPSCANGNIPPDPAKKIPATHNSVSLFLPNGKPLSPESGFTKGNIWWPQGTVSDREGNIWIANCGNDTITLIPKGNPLLAKNFPLPGAGTPEAPNLKPFAIAIDPKGRAWVTGNNSGEVYMLTVDGDIQVKDTSMVDISYPIGISGDSKGNMWVNSTSGVRIPCVDPYEPQDGPNPSIVFFPADGGEPMQIINQGGLGLPWGNAIDGADSLWVFNFGQSPVEGITEDTQFGNTAISHFCGSGKCPQGLNLGDPISPPTGYTSDALDRLTGGGIDPSGNIWLMNNWKKAGPALYDINPGENSIVIVPGAATPVKTPLIGPPRTFAKPHVNVHNTASMSQ